MFGYNRILEQQYRIPEQQLIDNMVHVERTSVPVRIHNEFGYQVSVQVDQALRSVGESLSEVNYATARLIAKQIFDHNPA